ncbi:MAG: AarF/ABC1/UbiB kinase family protein [Epsilonproteobacteria bacterium]|nr:AarF/ABC1/UbiB kinase family protein [Campylobacterota bacterium]
MWHFYSPVRVYKIFILILSFFLLIKKREKLLFFRPLKPKELKDTINSLGASFIKLAQVLATRADFFDRDYLEELKSLHDELPPMSQKEFQILFNRSVKKDIFKSFDQKPIASASIGQVHIGYLKDGTKVAVKLKRFNIKKQVISDIKILRAINYLFKPLFSHYTKNSIEAVINEFSNMILQEISFKKEVENLEKFSKKYANSKVLFPKAYKEYCNDEVIVMSFMEGFRFDDKEALKRANIDFRKIIDKLVNFYAEQMLINGFFHADPHPGNLLVNKKGELILLDFGMVKKIPNQTRIAIINMIKAAHEQDYELYVLSAKKLGVIAYEAPESEMAEFVENMFEIFSDNSLSATSMQNLAFEVLESTRNLPFKLPQEAIYILRVSAIIEGLGTTYIENFNGIKDILPILQKNIPRALGIKNNIFDLLYEEIKSTPLFIKDFKEVIKAAKEGDLKVELSPYQLEYLQKETKEYIRGYIFLFFLIFFAIFLILIEPSLKWLSILIFIFASIKIIYK